MDIGSRIQQIRGKMPRAEFAELLGVHPQTLYMYEKNKRVVDVELVQRLCSKFNISVEWLIFGGDQLQAAVSDREDEHLRREIAEKEAVIAQKEERINTLQSELIAAQSGALKAFELAVGALRPAVEAAQSGEGIEQRRGK